MFPYITAIVCVGFVLFMTIECMFGWKWLLFESRKKHGMLPCNHRNRVAMNPKLDHFWCLDCEHTVNCEGEFIWNVFPNPNDELKERVKTYERQNLREDKQ